MSVSCTGAADAIAIRRREGCQRVSVADHGRIPDEIADRQILRVGFAVKFDDEVSPFGVTSVFVMPGRTSRLEAVLVDGDERFLAVAEAGELTRESPTVWTYRAPQRPGVYALTLCDTRANQTLFVNVFVLEPYEGQDVFHGYRVGKYERLPLNDDPAYEMPRGMVRVTKQNETTWVSPHFQLRQFLLFVDNARDGWMDDLTGDGEATRADVRVISAVIEELVDDAWYAPFTGGLGLYGPKPHRGPFVHADTRGRLARW